MLGTAEILQAVRSQINQPHALGQEIPDKLRGGLGKDYLTAMGGGLQAGRPVHGRTEIVAVPLFTSAGVQRHAHPQTDALGPDFGLKRRLGHISSLKCVPG